MSRDLETIFNEVAGLSSAEREKYFADHPVSMEMREEVESLLEHDGGTGAPLSDYVAASAEVWVRQRDADESFGRYRRVRLLGSGGMGSVYLAQRTDGEVEQLVAMKFLRFGVDTAVGKGRFLRERQILASLRHPGIAQMLDAGHTPSGQPFLVMEYIDGTAIDVYCANLSLREKLGLFLQVCEAVSYAHRNLIIHRDLKPSNILVDGNGRAKLLDFGIAKIVDSATDQTRTRERMLTPEYASPEQVRGTAQSTSTDVYSLGAVLYKLLTGQPAHVFAAGADESVEVVICTKEPVQPSRLNKGLPRDLDFVLGMALRKEADSRYASVEAFMDDIRAFLEWRPVRARSMNVWYRSRKFIRRYWIPTAALSIAMAGMAGGLIVASREREIAQRRFNEVRQLSSKLLDVDVLARQLPGAASTRQFIVNTSLDYLQRLSKDAAGDPDLALELGTAYMRVGRVQGVPISTNLGQTDNAEQNLRRAERLIETVLATRPTNRTAMIRAAQIAHDQMILAEAKHPATEALPLARKSAAWLDKYLRSGELEKLEAEAVVIVGMNLAGWFSHEDKPEEAHRLLRRTIEIAKATNQLRQAGAAQIAVARALRGAGDLDGALAAIREGVVLLQPAADEKRIGPLSRFGLALVTQGDVVGEDEGISFGRFAEAADLFERGYRIALNQARQDVNDSESRIAALNRGTRLAGVLRHSDPRRALEICDEILGLSGEVKNNGRARRDEVKTLVVSSYVLRRLGRAGEARGRLDSAFARLRDLKVYPAETVELGSEAEKALRALAEYEGERNVRRGIESYQELLDKVMASKPKPESRLEDANDLSAIYGALCALHRRAGQNEAAGGFQAKRVALWDHWERTLPGNAFIQRRLREAHIETR